MRKELEEGGATGPFQAAHSPATPDYDFHSVDQFEELVVTAGPAPLLWKRDLASFVCPATPDYNFHSVDQFEELVVTAGPAPLLWKRDLASFVCPATPDYNFHSVDQFEELVVTADQEKPRIPGHLHALQGGYCREHNMRLQFRVAAAAFWSAYWRTHVPNARDLYAPAPRPPEDSRAPEERTEERGNVLRLMMLIMMLMDDQPHQFMYLTITFRRFSPSPQQMEFQPGRNYFLVSTARPGHLHALQGGYCRGHNMHLQFRVAAAAFWLAYWRTRVPDARDLYAPDPRPPEDPRAPRSGRRSAAIRSGSSAPPLLLPPAT